MPQSSQAKPPRQLVFFLLAAALALNLGLLVLYYVPAPKKLVGDENYYFGLASAIAAGQSVQHDPLWPPLYGEATGILFSIVGPHLLTLQLIQIGLWLATGYLLFQITERLVGQTAVACVALALYLFAPDLMAFSHYLWPETLHMFLMMAGLWLVICHGRSRWAFIASGVLFGLALLTKSLLLPMLPVLLVFVLLVKNNGTASRVRIIGAGMLAGACLTTVVMLLMVSPQDRGELSVGGSTVFNVWVGLNDTARMDTEDVIVGQEHRQFTAAGANLAVRNEVYRDKIGDLLRQQGLVATLLRQVNKQYFRLFDATTFFVAQLPGKPRAAYTFRLPALAALLQIYTAAFQAAILLAGAIGVTCLRGRPLSWLHFFLAFILYNLAILLVLHVTTRYMLQLLPMWIVFAATGVYGGAEWLHSRQLPAVGGFVASRTRLVVGALLGLLLLVLSFRSLLFGL